MLKTTANNTAGQEILIENLSFEWVFEDGFVLKGNGNAAMFAGNNITVRNCEFKGINIPDTQYAAIVSIGQTGGSAGPNTDASKYLDIIRLRNCLHSWSAQAKSGCEIVNIL